MNILGFHITTFDWKSAYSNLIDVYDEAVDTIKEYDDVLEEAHKELDTLEERYGRLEAKLISLGETDFLHDEDAIYNSAKAISEDPELQKPIVPGGAIFAGTLHPNGIPGSPPEKELNIIRQQDGANTFVWGKKTEEDTRPVVPRYDDNNDNGFIMGAIAGMALNHAMSTTKADAHQSDYTPSHDNAINTYSPSVPDSAPVETPRVDSSPSYDSFSSSSSSSSGDSFSGGSSDFSSSSDSF